MPDIGLAALDEIRARAAASEADAGFTAAARTDVPRLLAALDAVLARHTPKTVIVHNMCGAHHSIVLPGCPDCTTTEHVACKACDPVCPADNAWPCAEYRAISRALLGQDSAAKEIPDGPRR
jgi:hypothetical protein